MSETPTPRTDVAQFHRDSGERPLDDDVVTVDFARTLERELTAARAELALHEDNARQSLEEIEALRGELAALRAEQVKPLDRPDKPGHWWRWCDIFKKWEGPLWISLPAQTSLGKWLPAAPPRDLRENEDETQEIEPEKKSNNGYSPIFPNY